MKTVFHYRSRNQGFALIITISLMALMAVIVFGLLSLSVSTVRSSNQTNNLKRAQENARMALMLALGDLQKQAGIDQRITATANHAGTIEGNFLPVSQPPGNDQSINKISKGLSALQNGTRHWTGVFSNRDNPEQIFSKTPDPSLRSWLVSGTNSLPGGVSPSDSIFSVDPDGKVSDKTKAVVLVGENSVGKTPAAFVTAPLIALRADNSTALTGRFAWWVGDEGTKAVINIPSSINPDVNFASITAQRRGWEAETGFEQYPLPDSPEVATLDKLTSLAQVSLLLPATLSSSSGLSPLQRVFHSATTDSRIVIADPLRGGTKIDLTSILNNSLPTTNPIPEVTNFPIQGTRIVPKSVAPGMAAPNWDAMKSFHDLASTLDSGSLLVTAESYNTPAIAPIITDLRLLLGARIVPKDPNTGTYTVNPCGKVAIAIANPYSVPLKWSQDLEIEIFNQTPAGNYPSRIWPLGAGTAPTYVPRDTYEAAVFNKTIFRIEAGSLPAGEARAFTIGTNTKVGRGAVVDLVPFSTSSPFDFNNCAEVDHPTIYRPPFTMDVRESWQTSQVGVEMKLAGSSSSGLLRRIERFELDNGYFSRNQRYFTAEEAKKMTQPFGLMLYSFQISRPGTDYLSDNLIPPTYEMGQRASTLRTYADFNLRATHIPKVIASYNPAPFFMENNDSLASMPANPPGGDTGSLFTRDLAISPIPWGRSASGPKRTILFSVPNDLASLAQLQHADLTGDDRYASVGHQPGYAFANSYASPFVKRNNTMQTRTDYVIIGSPNSTSANRTNTRYYDISYLLNASLWDSYFLSSIPFSGSLQPKNPSMLVKRNNDELRDPAKAASHLMVNGAFNVNSTDKIAWKAFLNSARLLRVKTGDAPLSEASFPRSLNQSDAATLPPSGNSADSFSGLRKLSDDQIDALAGEIVKQVRIRGPFLSISHFVNRALAPITDQPALSRSGALQSAIDESGINISPDGSKNAFAQITPTADRVTLRWKQNAPRADMDGQRLGYHIANADPSHVDWAVTSTDLNYGAVASIVADQEMLKDSKYLNEQGYRSTAIPGWLTQADVLQVIGNSITVRSDTFRIRAYGEALDPAGNVLAKAWCEAIVQRHPEYLDSSQTPDIRGNNLSPTNKTYGRRFQITSFRWLSAEDI